MTSRELTPPLDCGARSRPRSFRATATVLRGAALLTAARGRADRPGGVEAGDPITASAIDVAEGSSRDRSRRPGECPRVAGVPPTASLARPRRAATAYYALLYVLRILLAGAGGEPVRWLLVEATTAARRCSSARRGRAPKRLEFRPDVTRPGCCWGSSSSRLGSRQAVPRSLLAGAPDLRRRKRDGAVAYPLLIAGLAAKVGWAPVHNWLPDVTRVRLRSSRHCAGCPPAGCAADRVAVAVQASPVVEGRLGGAARLASPARRRCRSVASAPLKRLLAY